MKKPEKKYCKKCGKGFVLKQNYVEQKDGGIICMNCYIDDCTSKQVGNIMLQDLIKER